MSEHLSPWHFFSGVIDKQGINMNLKQLENDWIKRGFSFGIGTIKANDSIDNAVHDDKDELVFMECGK